MSLSGSLGRAHLSKYCSAIIKCFCVLCSSLISSCACYLFPLKTIIIQLDSLFLAFLYIIGLGDALDKMQIHF